MSLTQCHRGVSIRSPHRSKGRRGLDLRATSPRTSFNPLPSPKQGETRLTQISCLPLRMFQSAPLTEARGDAGCCNQRNTKKLDKWMREPPFICILLTKREHIPRCNLLLAIKLLSCAKVSAKRRCFTFAHAIKPVVHSNPRVHQPRDAPHYLWRLRPDDKT